MVSSFLSTYLPQQASGSSLLLDWEQLDASGPSVAFHAGAILGDYLYIQGGIDRYQETRPLSGFYRFSLLGGGGWEKLPDGPTLSHHVAVAADASHLLLVGGWNGHERIPDVHIFDVDQRSWTRAAVDGFPSGAGLNSHTVNATANGDYIVIGREGGLRTQRRSGNTYTLSGSVQKAHFHFEPAAIGTASRSGHTTTWLTNGALTVIGGRDNDLVELHSLKRGIPISVRAIDKLMASAESGNPKVLKKPPCGRKNHVAMAGANGSVLIFGGETFDGRSKVPVGEFILMKSKPGLSFYRFGESRIRRAGAVCCVNADDGRAYLHGGLGGSYAVENHLLVL